MGYRQSESSGGTSQQIRSNTLAKRGTSGFGEFASLSLHSGAGDEVESDSSGDDGSTTRTSYASRSAGLGGSGGMDGTDLANSSTSTQEAQSNASAAMEKAVNSASNTEQKALVVAEAHGRSLREIAQAILEGKTSKLDAETLVSFADTLERFSNAVGRTSTHIQNAQAAQEEHQAQLAAAGGADRQEVKSYSLGRGVGGGGRHTGRYRLGMSGQDYTLTGGGGRSTGNEMKVSRTMSSRGY
ncbi:hypothetical protein JCM3765_003352 [Sporobolomyces pararoseus]